MVVRWAVALSIFLVLVPVQAQETGHELPATYDFHKPVTGDMLRFDPCEGQNAATFETLESGFTFMEGSESIGTAGALVAGCGTASLELADLAADHLHVRFSVQRLVDDGGTGTEPNFAQFLLAPSSSGEETLTTVIDPAEGARPSQFMELNLGEVATPGLLKFRFEDRTMAEGPTPGHGYGAIVRDISVEYSGLPANYTIEERIQRSGDLRVDHYVMHVVVTQEMLAEFLVDLRVRIDDAYHPERVVTPTGAILTERGTRNEPGIRGYSANTPLFEHLGASGDAQLVVPRGITAEHGPGTYTIVFSRSSPADPTVASVGAVSAALAIPAVFGAVATVAAVDFRRKAEFQRTAGNTLLGTVGVLLAAYAALVIYTLSGNRLTSTAFDPLGPVGLPILASMLGLTLAFVGMFLFRWRILESSLNRDLRRQAQIQADLERTNAALQSFASAVAHDLKAPLRTMSLYTGMLSRDTKDEAVLETADKVQGGAKQMAALIDNLLTFAQAGSRVEVAPVRMDDVAAQVLASLEADASNARIEVSPLPTVRGDPSALWQVLGNLVVNALRHAGPNPHVRIRGGTDDQAWFVVEDNGAGIPEEDRVRIFEPFARGATGAEGNGLGLATVHRIVTEHQGTITVGQSKLGGAAFKVTLPKADPPQSQ